MSKIIDAVSIVITCGEEIFAIQRQNFLAAFPGYWAFPGGKVENDDASFLSTHPLAQKLDQRLLGALVREGIEELGIDINVEIQLDRVAAIDYLGVAITPDFNPYRFATYFFKVDFKTKIDFIVDRNEARYSEWMSAQDLLKQYEAGSLLAVPPVIKVIEHLERNPGTKFISDLSFSYDAKEYVPYIESLRGVRQVMPLSNTLPPASRTNSFLIGDENSPRILVDPSPKDDEEYRKFKNTIGLFGVDKILLTHHHPDHYERSHHLALELNIPMLMSEYTYNRILEKNSDFFNLINVSFLQNGDKVTSWLNRDVLIMEVPGHDEGQLALYAHDLSWFIAGDLFQGVGTVVIGGAEGDMTKYFQTLQKIIDLEPKVLFPSHGIGLGGTSILEKTLKHRIQRESQILSLHQEGLLPEDMIPRIYGQVDKNLWPYALENINKHLQKLREDKLIL